MRALGLGIELGTRLGHFQQRRRATGVIVGAVVDITCRAETVAGVAVADVIVVSANQHDLFFQRWVAAVDLGQDIARIGIEGLKVRAAVAGRRKAEGLELCLQIAGRRTATPAAGGAPFERVVGQCARVLLQLIGRNRLGRGIDVHLAGPGYEARRA